MVKNIHTRALCREENLHPALRIVPGTEALMHKKGPLAAERLLVGR